MWMIHPPWTCACGNASDFRETADFLDKVNSSVISMYVERTGATREHITQLVEDDSWLTAEEAVDEGFADSVVGKGEGADSEDGAAENNTPRRPMSEAKEQVVAAWAALATKRAEQTTEQPLPVAAMARPKTSVAAIVAATATNQPAERGPQQKDQPMTDEEKKAQEALENRVTLMSEQLTASNTDLEKVRAENSTLVEANAELKVQLKESEKALATLREANEKALAEKKELEDKLLESEVDALVGKKITAEEKSRFVRLAKADRELFDETVEARSNLSMDGSRIVPPEQDPQAQRPPTTNDSTDVDLADLVDQQEVA
jgi:hypothetical protein